MTPAQINQLCERLIAFRDLFPHSQRSERDLLADACNALDGYTKLSREIEWQPIATVPEDVREAILFWPAYELSDDGYVTSTPFTFSDGSRGLVGRGLREPGFDAWDTAEHEIEANGSFFDDNYAFGEPTHWKPLPAEPIP